jgi:hypothetical protein
MIMTNQVNKKATQDRRSAAGVGTSHRIRVPAGKNLISASPKSSMRITKAERSVFTKQQSGGQLHMVSGVDLSRLPAEVVEAVRGYHPEIEIAAWAKWAPVVIGFLPIVGPPTPDNAKITTRAILRLVLWCEEQGLPTGSNAEIFNAENVESFAAMSRAQLPKIKSKTVSAGGNGASLLDMQVSRLRSAGRIINPSSNWPILREKGKGRGLRPIYLDKEITALHASAKKIPSIRKRRIALASLAMGFGAGLSGGEQQRALPEHIYQDSHGGTWIQVTSGSLSQTVRLVPVAVPWGLCLRKAIDLNVEKYGEWVLPIARSANAVSDNLRNLPFDRSCPKLSTLGMRTTWMVQRIASGVWLSTLAQYAGLASMDTLIKAARMLPPQDHENALRGMTQRSMSIR